MRVVDNGRLSGRLSSVLIGWETLVAGPTSDSTNKDLPSPPAPGKSQLKTLLITGSPKLNTLSRCVGIIRQLVNAVFLTTTCYSLAHHIHLAVP